MAKYVEIDGEFHEAPGHAALWGWFGLSRASWLTLPRVAMHEMPDDWQARMAALLHELHAEFPNAPVMDTSVSWRVDGRMARMPEWIDYRHPCRESIAAWRGDCIWIEWEAPEGHVPVPADWSQVRRGDGEVFDVSEGEWSAGTLAYPDGYELIPEYRVVAYRLKP